MGKIKELLLDDKEEELTVKINGEKSIMYADLLNPQDIFNGKCDMIYITTIDGNVDIFTPDDIIELNGLMVKIQEIDNIVRIIPLDKIVSCQYHYKS